MTRIFRILAFLILPALTALGLVSCLERNDHSVARAEGIEGSVSATPAAFTSPQLHDALEALCISGSVPLSLVHRDTLLEAYRQRGYEPIWVLGDSYPGRIQGILPYLTNAWEHGLDPAWYHADELRQVMARSLTPSLRETERLTILARIELLVSDALLQYAEHLRYGLFDPRLLDPAYHHPVRRASYREFYEPLSTRNIGAYLRSIQPAETRYRTLQEALRGWRMMKLDYRWARIPAPGVKKIVCGDTSSILPFIAQRLLMTGELSGSFNAPSPLISTLDAVMLGAYALDSNRLDRIGAVEYDSALVKAVMRYQMRHGLLQDGVIGIRTIARMNRGLDEYIDQIGHTLERFRWTRYPTRGRYVMVNIPAFWLYAMEDNKVYADMAVCTGLPSALSYDPSYARLMRNTNQSYDRKNYETPLLHGTLTHLILNPVWNVPVSIGARETYFSALKDPSYLRRKGYRVYMRDSLVDHSSIDWSKYNPRSMPFRFAQSPGNANALGHIKFMFTNDFSIYLHDTPQRWAFNRATRAVSHGCVRIEQPMKFADYLLSGNNTWNLAKVQQLITNRVGTRSVPLHQRTPLYIDYFTSWVDDSGVVQFRDDVYRKDAVLGRAFSSYERSRSRAH